MSTAVHRRPIRREFLEMVDRALLARVLAPHAGALEARGFAVGQLAADGGRVHALWDLLTAIPTEDPLAALAEDVAALGEVGTSAGQEALIARDAEGLLDRELGAENLATTAFLVARELFEAARPLAGSAQPRTFALLAPAKRLPLDAGPAKVAVFDQTMAAELEARGRALFFRSHWWRSGNERHVEMVFARLATARQVVGKTEAGAHDVLAHVTDRSTERAHAIFHENGCTLSIAGPEWMKELVRRTMGAVFWENAAHFRAHDVVSLDALADLETALSVGDVPDLDQVTLQVAWVRLADGSWLAVGADEDVPARFAGEHLRRALEDGGVVTKATFHLVMRRLKKRPLALEVTARGRLKFDRKKPEVVRVVRDWLTGRGMMRMPETPAAENE